MTTKNTAHTTEDKMQHMVYKYFVHPCLTSYFMSFVHAQVQLRVLFLFYIFTSIEIRCRTIVLLHFHNNVLPQLDLYHISLPPQMVYFSS